MTTGALRWTDTTYKTIANRGGPTVSKFGQSGVIHYRSEIKFSNINDGSAKTYLIGEKFMSPYYYESLAPAGPAFYADNQGAWCGFEWDNHRIAWNPASTYLAEDFQPRQDFPGTDNPTFLAFGSAHPGSMNMAMCDGSVQSISYDIDRDTHRYLAYRLDDRSVTLEP